MRFLALRFLSFTNVIGVAMDTAAPMHLGNRSLLLEDKIGIAALAEALLLNHRVHSTILTTMRHLHLLLV